MFAYLGNKGLFKFRHECLRHLFGNGYLVDIDTYLSGVGQFEERYLTGCIFEVRIGSHDTPVTRLAA